MITAACHTEKTLEILVKYCIWECMSRWSGHVNIHLQQTYANQQNHANAQTLFVFYFRKCLSVSNSQSY